MKKEDTALQIFDKAFAFSCNPYFINLSQKLGYARILSMADRLGLGKPTRINEQGISESSGLLPKVDQHFTLGDLANISIGQGKMLSTPLQIADIVATIANKGIKNRVNIVDCVKGQDNLVIKKIRKNEAKRILSERIARKITKNMQDVVNIGTGLKASIEGKIDVAGKTGTAETGQFTNNEKIIHAWFAGFFPVSHPKYSIAVFIENGKSGGDIAASIFGEIAQEILALGLME